MITQRNTKQLSILDAKKKINVNLYQYNEEDNVSFNYRSYAATYTHSTLRFKYGNEPNDILWNSFILSSNYLMSGHEF